MKIYLMLIFFGGIVFGELALLIIIALCKAGSDKEDDQNE